MGVKPLTSSKLTVCESYHNVVIGEAPAPLLSHFQMLFQDSLRMMALIWLGSTP